MGIAYRLDGALALTLTVFDGKITGDEWRSAVHEIFADPSWPPGRLNLTDLRTADASALTGADRAEILSINARHAHKLVGMKSAAIGGSTFDAARKFAREDRASGLRLIAFDDLAPACTWLGVDVAKVRSMIDDLRARLRGPTSTPDPGEVSAPDHGN
jgi:hypothetical protein